MVAHVLIPALGRQRQASLCIFKASLVYKVSSSQGYTEKPYLKKQWRLAITFRWSSCFIL